MLLAVNVAKPGTCPFIKRDNSIQLIVSQKQIKGTCVKCMRCEVKHIKGRYV